MRKSRIENCIIIGSGNDSKEPMFERNPNGDGSLFVDLRKMAIVSLDSFDEDAIRKINEFKKRFSVTESLKEMKNVNDGIE
jgi:hypothetical protein